ncbi:MAG TPA: beta-ketoacyl synthase N-terminal-like domain-containing protein, partial [Pseudonocardiaceae bacterium]|nr:beta-ketoacyl synthase N-terminal-like domain-containing protein [Pseudonocardiaceae bacterium]
VVHTAGVAHWDAITELTVAQLAEVTAKAAAATHLDELLATEPLEAFVLFSSIAGVWGSGNQAGYAAANAHLDALAETRRARGRPATSIAWGLWAGAGMGSAGDAGARLRRFGINAMSPDLAVSALQRAVNDDEPCVTVADIDWDRFLPLFTATRPRPLLEELARTVQASRPGTGEDQPRPDPDSALERWKSLPASQQRTQLHQLVLANTAAVTAAVTDQPTTGERDIHPQRSFRDLGFDSLMAVELRNRLAAATGLALPATAAFDHPTPTAFADHLADLMAGSHRRSTDLPAPAAAAAPPHGGEPGRDEPIAVIGMACRYPGGVASPEDLWTLVSSGADATSDFPTDRGWDLDRLYHPDPDRPGTSYTCRGGFLHNADQFDPDFFGISPREALATDPQQRILLEVAWQTLERAGIDPATLRGSATGVFAGTWPQDYGGGIGSHAPEDVHGYRQTGGASSVASGRIAYALGLGGPAVTIDTACSSSLVAVHLAAQSLRDGECSLALAGGVTVMATPAGFVEFSRQRGLAPDGRCKPFAAAADGTSWGEGAGLLLLERLGDARRHNHSVLAVIRGSAVNSDGASNGLTAPNGPAQQRVIRQALANARLTPSDIGAVEAHGTGTTLGDPIEAQALLATYGQQRPAEAPLRLGSVKSNIGHTQAASGVAGVIKMVMAMRHGLLPKTLHIDTPSPHVDWTAGAVALLTDT